MSLAACADWFAKAPPPNILLILADDLGYSDLGVLGSEINTPNLDALARAGKLLTNFHVGPTCSPTRAMLLSGADTHRAGLGTMNGMQSEEQLGLPGYEGFLNKQMITLPRLLREAGYHTYMAGKWQLGYQDGHYPLDRGFDRAFWLKHGGASHFSDMRGIMEPQAVAYWAEDRERVESLPDDFYSSVYITDKLMEYIDSNRGDGKPFFAYAAYTAPHWPLQAPQEYIDKYEGVYAGGYDPIRRSRVENMRAAGLMKTGSTPAPRHPEWPDWKALSDEQKKLEVRRMQLYAAMVEALDDNIGRLIQYLQDAGEYDNTFIMFFSDNGAEGNNPQDLGTNPQWVPAHFDNSYENMGKPGSYVSTGPGWAPCQQHAVSPLQGLPHSGRPVGARHRSVPGPDRSRQPFRRLRHCVGCGSHLLATGQHASAPVGGGWAPDAVLSGRVPVAVADWQRGRSPFLRLCLWHRIVQPAHDPPGRLEIALAQPTLGRERLGSLQPGGRPRRAE